MHSASCTEALSRLCNSFPPEIQGSIRAQLADCLVGVSCQRLDFLAAHRLRVPRCELLLPSSGAKGSIRSGNFSQLANVLQSGGEEGMWTFERYQRWIDQVSEWVRPAPVSALAATTATAPPRDSKAASFVSRAPAPPPQISGRSMPTARSAPRAPAASAARPASTDDVIEVPLEETDLAELAELARKVVERKP
jgi:twitching motility protein PilT